MDSEEIANKDLDKWLEGTLNQLIYYALFNKEFAKKLCKETSRVARGNKDLVAIIKKNIVGKQGRFPATPPGWNYQLLYHYAYLMDTLQIEDYRRREDATIDELTQFHERVTGRKIEFEAMQNQISKAIKAEAERIEDMEDWVRDVINERKGRRKRN